MSFLTKNLLVNSMRRPPQPPPSSSSSSSSSQNLNYLLTNVYPREIEGSDLHYRKVLRSEVSENTSWEGYCVITAVRNKRLRTTIDILDAALAFVGEIDVDDDLGLHPDSANATGNTDENHPVNPKQ